ncbi:acetyltransferase (GNAT) family protein [Aquisalibacillus elongatus]|uniref:Acetyltransferase (GNAT) family protein n=2 Tax=Aquisalibacillus elongatus TaxID=485577 RepID=A0A3N5AZA0_9BACI|nr:GNAT family N-acetyltransferase [Aquisalibacillus elongatus]RPF50394.1 acetyltransferase (GNAT) family protein [Aquisalibacillus elongatus]
MNFEVKINLTINNHEVPELRECVGWERRDADYPALFERCNFWAGVRDVNGRLVAFGYVCGMGLQHGYLEDIMVHPDYQGMGIGVKLVKTLLNEADHFGLEIVTVTLDEQHAQFYQNCGFKLGRGGTYRTK